MLLTNHNVSKTLFSVGYYSAQVNQRELSNCIQEINYRLGIPSIDFNSNNYYVSLLFTYFGFGKWAIPTVRDVCLWKCSLHGGLLIV